MSTLFIVIGRGECVSSDGGMGDGSRFAGRDGEFWVPAAVAGGTIAVECHGGGVEEDALYFGWIVRCLDRRDFCGIEYFQ